MGIDLLDDNNTRYFSIPDHADLSFPDSDWFIAIWTNINNNDSNLFQYIISNNAFAASNSFNLFLVETSEASGDLWRVRTATKEFTAATATGADNINRLVVVQRNGSNLEMWHAELGKTATLEFDSAYSDGAINGGVWNVGRRVDGQALRYYENPFGDLIKGNVALTQAQVELLALGVSPTLVTDPSNLVLWFQFREDAATIGDIISGHIATRNGTGLVTVDHFPVVSGVSAFTGVVTAIPDIDPAFIPMGIGPSSSVDSMILLGLSPNPQAAGDSPPSLTLTGVG